MAPPPAADDPRYDRDTAYGRDGYDRARPVYVEPDPAAHAVAGGAGGAAAGAAIGCIVTIVIGCAPGAAVGAAVGAGAGAVAGAASTPPPHVDYPPPRDDPYDR